MTMLITMMMMMMMMMMGDIIKRLSLALNTFCVLWQSSCRSERKESLILLVGRKSIEATEEDDHHHQVGS